MLCLGINIDHVATAHPYPTDFFEILVDIGVNDLHHLNNIIASLCSKEVVQNIKWYQT
jgi:hypothetical protein